MYKIVSVRKKVININSCEVVRIVIDSRLRLFYNYKEPKFSLRFGSLIFKPKVSMSFCMAFSHWARRILSWIRAPDGFI